MSAARIRSNFVAPTSPRVDANIVFKLHVCHCTLVGKAVAPYFQAVFGMPNQIVVVRDIALDVAAITLWAKCCIIDFPQSILIHLNVLRVSNEAVGGIVKVWEFNCVAKARALKWICPAWPWLKAAAANPLKIAAPHNEV